MSSDKNNTAPGEHLGQLDQSRPPTPTTEQTPHDSRNKAEKLVSIRYRITGPLKSKITNRVKMANASITAVVKLDENTVMDQSPGDESQARSIVHKAQQDLYFLEVLPELITKTMEIPEIAQHEDHFQLQEEVSQRYQERQAGDVSQKLSEAIVSVIATLLEFGIEIPEYVPTADDIRKANKAAHEEQEYMVIDVPNIRPLTAPSVASPNSFQGSGISSMIYDDSQMDTITAIHNSKILIEDLVREKAESAERDRSQQQLIRQLTEQLAQQSELNVQRNSLFNELSTSAPSQHRSMVNAGTHPKSAGETPILTKTSNYPPAETTRPLVQTTMTAPVNHAATEPSFKQPELSSSQYLELMNAINNIQAQINNNQRSYAGIESTIGHRENTRDSKPDIRIPSRNQHRPPSKHSKTAYIEDSDLESSLYSDGERARVVCSGSGDNYGHRRHSRRNSNSETARDQKHKRSEPKLSTVLSLLPKFDGSGDWEEFRDAFNADVLSRDDIRPNQMHKILSDHLIGKARDCVAHSKDHAAAIEETFNSLEQAFGSTHSTEKLLKKLNKLSFHQTDTEQMRQDLAKIKNLIMLLLEKGICNTDDRMTKVVTSKLPQTLRKCVLDKWKKNKMTMTIKDVINTASEHISSLELEQEIIELNTTNSINEIPTSASINYTNSRPSGDKNRQYKPVYDASRVKAKFFDHVTKTSLPGYYAPGSGINLKLFPVTFPFDNTEPWTCDACSTTGHSSIRCKDSSSTFRQNVEKKKLCPLCLASDHTIQNCKSTRSCIYCSGMHHTGGCPTKEFYRDLDNYPNGAKPRQTFFLDNKKKNNSQ